MSALFPDSPSLVAYWNNIFGARDSIRSVSQDEWDLTGHTRPSKDKTERDKFGNVYCQRGGFITDIAEFDPLAVGVMPKSIEGSDPDQMLALKVACEAIADAGYDKKSFNAEKAEVILGRTSAPGRGSLNLIQQGHTIGQVLDVVSGFFPDWSEEKLATLSEELRRSLDPCNSDTIPGAMPSVLAGRIAGRLGFHGRSFVLDAACASSLIAVENAVDDLRSGRSDLAIAGGVFVNSFTCFYQMFCGLEALSPSETIRPFDDNADGTLLGEGIGMVVLKRESDALADGDKIYAFITGVASSSDGKGTSMLAPSSSGEAIAIDRAYKDAGLSPLGTGFVEAHGTGTKTGDIAELNALQSVFQSYQQTDGASEDVRQQCAIGSVKSMIGHTQAASGIAGLIKAALALYHRVIPPTLNVDNPNTHFKWQDSYFYVNRESRPWIHPKVHPEMGLIDPSFLEGNSLRQASVSAFGFGGVNAHCVLEESKDDYQSGEASLLTNWDSEVFIFAGKTSAGLADLLTERALLVLDHANNALKDLAFTFNSETQEIAHKDSCRVAIVARSAAELAEKLSEAADGLRANQLDATILTRKGIYLNAQEAVRKGKLAFVLPGLGSAYPNMLHDLCIYFPEVRAIFDFVDYLAKQSGSKELPSEKIFPRPEFGTSQNGNPVAALASMDAAVVTVLMAEWALYTLLLRLSIVPEVLVGCSTGEFAALTMGGAANILTSASMFYKLSTDVANSIPKEELAELRSVKAKAPFEKVEPHLALFTNEVFLSGDLSDQQVILTGNKKSVDLLVKALEDSGIEADYLPVAIPYHTALVAGAVEPESEEVDDVSFEKPEISTWSCSTGQEYPADSAAVKQITTELFSKPILLRQTIRTLYRDQGVTKFVEVGPKDTLTPVIDEILQPLGPHLAVASNRASGSGITQLNNMLAQLFCAGVEMNLDYLYDRRSPRRIDFAQKKQASRKTNQLLKLKYPALKLSDGWQERMGYDHQAEFTQPQFVVSQEQHRKPPANQAYAPAEGNQDGGETSIVSTYLDGLNDFHQKLMNMQSDVLVAYLDASDESVVESAPLAEYPLLNGARFGKIEEDLVIDVPLTLFDHCYLLDHAIGGTVRQHAEFGERVHLLPLTVALELMAEAGSFYFPNQKLAEIKHVRAYKRIRVGKEGVWIRLLAQKMAAEQNGIQVSIYKLSDASSAVPVKEDLLMSCEAFYGQPLEAKPIVPELFAGEWRASRYNLANLYGIDSMFHGPRMQSVVSVDGVRENEIFGTVEARAPRGWFNPESQANYVRHPFLIDPLLLDNSTQLVLYLLFERNEAADALLPFMIDSLSFNEYLGDVKEPVTVHAKFNSVNARGTDADVQLIQAGRVVAQFSSIRSRRIVLDPPLRSFVKEPSQSFFSSSIGEISPHFGALSEHFAASAGRLLNDAVLPADEGTVSWLADYILSPVEAQIYEALPNIRRKREWLIGRICAKDAVRELVWKMGGVLLTYADVEVFSDPIGSPVVMLRAFPHLNYGWRLSISHKDNVAAAVAVRQAEALGVGIDLELVAEKEEGFEILALTDFERDYLASYLSAERASILSQVWVAKEACAKAVGLGMGNNPKNFEIINYDAAHSVFTLRVSEAMKEQCHLNGVSLESALETNVVALDNAFLGLCLRLMPSYSCSQA